MTENIQQNKSLLADCFLHTQCLSRRKGTVTRTEAGMDSIGILCTSGRAMMRLPKRQNSKQTNSVKCPLHTY